MFAVVDLETTGSHPDYDNIIEIAIYLHDGQQVTGQFLSLIDPGKPIPPFISNLTGISNGMVAKAPSFSDVAEEVAEMLEGRIFVAHNVMFDHSFLKSALKREGFELADQMFCTLKTARTLLPGHESYKLSRLTKSLGIELKNAHRAHADALATAHILALMFEKSGGNLNPYMHRKEPKTNASKIPEEKLNRLPSQAGLFYLKNIQGETILIASASNIRKKAWGLIKRFSHKRFAALAEHACDVDFEITGSEVLASILEWMETSDSKPRFNRKFNSGETRFSLIEKMDPGGFMHLTIQPYKQHSTPLLVFSGIREAKSVLKDIVEQNNLFHNEKNTGNTGELFSIPADEYNVRVEAAISQVKSQRKNFIIRDKTGPYGEQVFFIIQNGVVTGYTQANANDLPGGADEIIDRQQFLPDAPFIFKTILRFVAKGKYGSITHITTI